MATHYSAVMMTICVCTRS